MQRFVGHILSVAWDRCVALAVFVGLGGYIYTNTNVWNEYRTRLDDDRWLADYEKAFLKYETLAQPSVTDVVLELDLDPHAPKLVTEGVYQLVNDTGVPIRELHVRLDRDTKALQMSLNGAARASMRATIRSDSSRTSSASSRDMRPSAWRSAKWFSSFHFHERSG